MEKNAEKLLEIKNLQTSFRIEGSYYAAVDNITTDVYKDEVFAIVGESGSGKSALALSITRLLNPNFSKIEGEVLFEGKNILSLTQSELSSVRGAGIGMIFQDPLSALNPLMKIGAQIEEVLTYHTKFNAEQKKKRAIELLNQVQMTNPELTYNQFPHELSGGMRQRAMIAIAIAAKPKLIIADEPTTALDVTIQAQILDLLRELKEETGASIIIITHDLGVVAEMADRVAVMYAGQIVELADVNSLFKNPKHPYTRSLLDAMPTANDDNERLHSIQGIVPPLQFMPRAGCRFAPRIPWIPASSHEEKPTYYEVSENHKVLCTCFRNFTLNND